MSDWSSSPKESPFPLSFVTLKILIISVDYILILIRECFTFKFIYLIKFSNVLQIYSYIFFFLLSELDTGQWDDSGTVKIMTLKRVDYPSYKRYGP